MPEVLAVEVQGLTKTYRGTRAVDDLSFTVRTGRVTAFLGPNGAGKTTTIRAVLGLLRPDAGRAAVFGRAYRELPTPATTVGALIDGAGFHTGRSGRDHLRVVAATAGLAARRVDDVLEAVELTEAADRRTGGYSLGMRQRLGLATALLGDPDLLVLDEPANGLDPAGIRWLRSFLTNYAEAGRTVLVSSHVLSEVEQFAQDVVVVRAGRLVTQTSVAALTATAVRVRTPAPDVLGAALRRAGAEVRSAANGTLEVTGASSERVGDLALSVGAAVHELQTSSRELEDVFLELVSTQESR